MPPYFVVGKILDAKRILKCLPLHNIENNIIAVKGKVIFLTQSSQSTLIILWLDPCFRRDDTLRLLRCARNDTPLLFPPTIVGGIFNAGISGRRRHSCHIRRSVSRGFCISGKGGWHDHRLSGSLGNHRKSHPRFDIGHQIKSCRTSR